MYKVAVIFTGDVRDCHVKKEIIKQFRNFDVFCGSYVKHKKYIEKIGKINHNILINPDKDIIPPEGLTKNDMQQNMLQWLHLNNILGKFREKLLEYDIIFKFRFDTTILNKKNYDFLNKIKEIHDNYIYCDSDRVFYGRTGTFLKAFDDFYDKIINNTFIYKGLNNDNSFGKSWKSELAFKNNLIEKKINKKKMHFKTRIIRGSYNKVTADGNKKLYNKSNLLGKFS